MVKRQEHFRILPSSTIFYTVNRFESLGFLHLEFLGNYPFIVCQKRAIHFNGEISQIIPSNFSDITSLDLAGCCYEERSNILEMQYQIWPTGKTLSQENIEFRAMINTYIHRLKKYRYDYRGLISSNMPFYEFPICPVLMCLLRGLDHRMQDLLKYGVEKIHTSKVIQFLRRGEYSPLYETTSVLDQLQRRGLNIRLPEPNWETFAMHRAFLVIEMMHVLFSIPDEFLAVDVSWKRCCRLIWRSIPDPYLTQEEIRRILSLLAVESSPTAINRMCEDYRNMFPEITALSMTPRALKHICRCFIRHCMKQHYLLPEGIEQLELPLALKYFLRLEL